MGGGSKDKATTTQVKRTFKGFKTVGQGENGQACASVTPGFPCHLILFSVFRNSSLIFETLLFTFLTLTNKIFKLQGRYHNQTYKAIHTPCPIMKSRAVRLGI